MNSLRGLSCILGSHDLKKTRNLMSVPKSSRLQSLKRAERYERGRRLAEAVETLKCEDNESKRQVAQDFGVALSSIYHHLAGRRSKSESAIDRQLLTPAESECLKERIIALDECGTPPRNYQVREMAHDILKLRMGPGVAPPGKNWVTQYLKRNKDLKSSYSRNIDCEGDEQQSKDA